MTTLRDAYNVAKKKNGPGKLAEVFETELYYAFVFAPDSWDGKTDIGGYPAFVSKETGKFVLVPFDEFLDIIDDSTDVPINGLESNNLPIAV